ncbi:hypothetical protein E3U23_11330 [Erythrobacter litoralis]|uniref:helix-turn-helix domain-containing protein n=1 Tax=Erythrobacter litoralis TaxID=39960 RepID=UPI002434B47F|nr:helix-turn-helix domain-containing protein [Erythrobacter litoralis]MDG6079781.1 hypothetical protein [Erythrobacter litoralis]
MAITAREQQMLDLEEEGLSPDEIAARMGIKAASVRRILQMYRFSFAEDRRIEAGLISGSMQLRKAVIAAGGHH